MVNKKIKVAMVTNHLGITGIGEVIMNYCRALDKNKYDLTIIAGQPISDLYKEECKKEKIQLIELPSRHGSPIKYYIKLLINLINEHYDIIHDHGNSPTMSIELTIAKIVGIKNRIAHCHTKPIKINAVYKILFPIFTHSYTVALACSKNAGEWLFGKNNYKILINGFDTNKFKFDINKRIQVREKLNINDKFVIGHVGRFNENKNQIFLLEIFNYIATLKSDALLLLVGTGPDFEKIKTIIDNNPYKNRIILYGESNNVSELYSAMDVFVFPSKSEGLGLVAVEAAINGLPCVVSDTVPREVTLSDKITFLSLDASAKEWGTTIISFKQNMKERTDFYNKYYSNFNKFNIQECVGELELIYSELAGYLNCRK